ncbi:hypothetical protein ACFOWZ_44020 [Lentzea rhizosphaerae]|uniref:WXG100 family type VII secretion target n=1 Tax=Lentzea rhizosphaerae TaxID=2041025 RepID=A0ABV8C944_9PSEU
MTGFIGMDPESVRALARQLEFKAAEIEAIATTLSAQIDGTTWLGQDADALRSDWSSTYRTQLVSVAAVLREASSRAINNAAQQEEASRA